MPAILTTLVGRRLCASPTQNHWALRDHAASIVAKICRRYRDLYQSDLQPRVTQTLHEAFEDGRKSLTQHYGAIQGLVELGPRVVESIVLPNVPAYLKRLEKALLHPNPIRAMEAWRCHGLLLQTCGRYAQRGAGAAAEVARGGGGGAGGGAGGGSQGSSRKELMPMMSETFGETLLPYTASRFYGSGMAKSGADLDPFAYVAQPALIDYAAMML